MDDVRGRMMRVLVEREVPVCEECGSGTFTWAEAQDDPNIMAQKGAVVDEIIALFREALISDEAVIAAVDAIRTSPTLDEEPPLEDVLDEWTVRQLWHQDGEYCARVEKVVADVPLQWRVVYGEGTGPTIDAAIRAAVRNAKEQG